MMLVDRSPPVGLIGRMEEGRRDQDAAESPTRQARRQERRDPKAFGDPCRADRKSKRDRRRNEPVGVNFHGGNAGSASFKAVPIDPRPSETTPFSTPASTHGASTTS